MSWGFITPNINEARPSATSRAKGTQGRTAKVAEEAEATGLLSDDGADSKDDEADSKIVKTNAASRTGMYIAHPLKRVHAPASKARAGHHRSLHMQVL